MMSKPNHRTWVLTSLGAATIGALVFACSSGNGGGNLNGYVPPAGGGGDAGPITGQTTPSTAGNDGGLGPQTQVFQAVGPAVYVPKVKNLMTGLAATDDEIAQVTADPTQLRTLVTGWMAYPQFAGKMQEFFRNAFQQNNVTLNQLETNTGFPSDSWLNGAYQAQFIQSLEDTFPNTAQALVSSGKPLTQALTSSTYMMTTAQLALLSYLDELHVDDTGKQVNRLTARNAIVKFKLDPGSTASIDDILNPSSGSYMDWPLAVPASMNVNGTTVNCASPTTQPAVVYDSSPTDAAKPVNNNQGQNYNTLFQLIFGGSENYTPCYGPDQYGNVPSFNPKPLLQDSDFSDWRLVTINQIDNTQNTSPMFFELPSLRSATSVSFHIPRVGFSGTLAFETNWGTNVTNEDRVDTNQSLIVSINQSIDGENTVATFPVGATDADHASNPACTGCHSQLDPIKEYFNHSYTLFFSDQQSAGAFTTPASFGIDGVSATGNGQKYVSDLMTVLAGHPRFPLAWAQKLQFWATSTPADETDPELIRIASAFSTANFDFKALALEVFSSPLVTFAAPTETTTTNGVLNSISRRDHWCAALSNRLGQPDICGQITPKPTNGQSTVGARASLLAVDEYFRAYAIPSLATSPDIFFRATVEAMCTTIATEVVDDNTDAGPSIFSSGNPSAAIEGMVTGVMGIPTKDPRFGSAQTILLNHYAAASLQAGRSNQLPGAAVHLHPRLHLPFFCPPRTLGKPRWISPNASFSRRQSSGQVRSGCAPSPPVFPSVSSASSVGSASRAPTRPAAMRGSSARTRSTSSSSTRAAAIR